MAERVKALEATLFQLEILRRIPKSGRKISSSELHAQLALAGFERSHRTVQRTLEVLCEHFDIECDMQSKPYGYCWKPNSVGLNIPLLTEHQSLVLMLAEKQLKHLLPASIMQSMLPFFEQARSNMIYHSKDKPTGEWLHKVASVPTSQPLIPAEVDKEVFEVVSSALFYNRWLMIEYRNQNGKVGESKVMPLAIAQQGSTTYLVVRYEGFDNERLLALHRIQKASMSSFQFERPADFSLKKYQEEGHLGFGNGRKIRLSFSISLAAGFHLTETGLSKDQKIIEQSDKHYRFQATVFDSQMLDWWLAKFKEDIWDIEKIEIE